jgi:hypothetical protein
MTKREIGAIEPHRSTDEIAWRHFWLANVMVDAGRQSAVKISRVERPTRKHALSRRLHRLHHMRATLGASRH